MVCLDDSSFEEYLRSLGLETSTFDDTNRMRALIFNKFIKKVKKKIARLKMLQRYVAN